MKVPFVDLNAQYNSIKQEIDQAISSVISETAFINGKYVEKFESEFARKTGRNHCVGVANGTDAIYIVLKSLGIGPGDEVITTACSWIATSETISQAGARPVFADIDPDYYTIDPARIEEKITARTKAIIPVHLYGQTADMNAISSICNRHGLYLIEDCAQAHFAEYKGRIAGTFGIAATYSFYPGKNLGAYGDAGAIITSDEALAKKCRMYANHGSLKKHQHEIEGINSRLDGIQAAILSVKLPYIDTWNDRRFSNALLYNSYLKDVPLLTTPIIRPDSRHIFHVYCIRVEGRPELVNFLHDNGIDTSVHYPTALPFLPAYSGYHYEPGDFPVAFAYQSKILSLPMYPELSREQIIFISSKISEFCSR
jgi:dTDP-4-amino-4,6-dideoxygalactose transaminase